MTLRVFDILGREVRGLADGEWDAGRHSATWAGEKSDGSRVGGGVYFVRMTAQSLTGDRSYTSLRKMIFVK